MAHLTPTNKGLRPFIANWKELAGHLLQRVHGEAHSSIESKQYTLLIECLFPANEETERYWSEAKSL
ncbi:MAG: hypothetical protein HC916_03890 [Coleofasciculaceae cyanobacterium SM2_1_6]|nr:hypothetical protein [Coleofasciculaceae cyanobacterium SM2_1_6]